MVKRYTHEQLVEKVPEESGLRHLETIYSTKSYHKWICSEGHVFEQSIKNLSRCPKCPECHKRVVGKYSTEEAKRLYEENGFKFLDDEYLGNKYRHNTECLVCGYRTRKKLNGALSGAGCIKCAKKATPTYEEVQSVLSKNNRELLDKSFKNTRQKVHVLCFDGDIPHLYMQSVNNILNGTGCPFCSGRYKFSVEEVNNRLEDRGVKFRLVSESYGNNRTLHRFKCVECGHEEESTYQRMLQKKTCSVCSPVYNFGDFPDTPHKLYYLRIEHDGEVLYKIGITGRDSVKDRFSGKGDWDKITVLRTLEFDTGQKAYELEQYYLNLFKDFRYRGEPILKSGGNTELLTKDCLGLDTL